MVTWGMAEPGQGGGDGAGEAQAAGASAEGLPADAGVADDPDAPGRAVVLMLLGYVVWVAAIGVAVALTLW